MAALDGTMEVPGVGPVSKKTLAVIGGGAGGLLLFLYWRSRQTDWGAVAAEEEQAAEDEYGGLTDGGAGGTVSGYDQDSSSDTQTTAPRTNAEWSNLATERLLASYENAAITDALGAYLARKPLSDDQMRIVQAAIAVAGYPPEGTYTIIPGGNTEISVAPSGLKVVRTGPTSVDLEWVAVAGADGYRVYRNGIETNVGHSEDTKITVGGLDPSTSYQFKVAAMGTGGKVGPASSWVTAKTSGQTLKAPTGLKARLSGTTIVYLSFSPVAGADQYRAYHNHSKQNVGGSRDTNIRVSGLKRKTTYKFHVRALAGNTTGPASSSVTIKTK